MEPESSVVKQELVLLLEQDMEQDMDMLTRHKDPNFWFFRNICHRKDIAVKFVQIGSMDGCRLFLLCSSLQPVIHVFPINIPSTV